MKSLDKRLIRMLKESKLQYIAIAVVIIIGLLVYITFNMAILNFENSVNNYYEKTNAADIYVELVKIPEGNINEVKSVNGVDNVQGRVVGDVPLKTDDPDEKVTLRISSIPEENEINKLYHIEGNKRFFSDTDIFLIEQMFEARGYDIGDVIQPQISGNIYDLEITAKVASSEYIYLMESESELLPNYEDFGVAYAQEEFVQNAFGIGNSYNEIIIDVKDGYNLEKVKNEVEKKLDKYGVKKIYTNKNLISNRVVTEEIKGGKQSANVVPLVFLIVAASILVVMINRMVKNDRMTIGVLKSLGYKDSEIIIHYSKLAVLIGLFGSIVGVIIGVSLANAFMNMYLLYYKVHYIIVDYYPFYLIGAVLLGVGFTVLAGLFGARKVLGIEPAESMRQEPPKKGHRIFLENTWIWKKMKFSTKMVWKNIFRSKRRVAFIAFGIAVTLMITLIPMFIFDNFFSMFNKQFGEFQTMDYDVKFERPVSEEAIDVLYDEIDLEYMEPRLEYPFEIEHKWKSDITSIIGLKTDSKVYNFETLDGKKIVLKKGDVFVSEGLAHLLNIKMGDTIQINNYIPGKDDLKVEVTHVINQGLGSNIYLDMNTMQSKLVEPNSINGVYINTEDKIKTKLETSKNISSIRSLEDIRSGFEEFMQITIASISTLLLFGFILGFAVIYNSTILTINDRRLEFSSLRIMGMSKNEIFFSLVKEKFIISVVGVLVGIPFSQYIANSIADIFTTEFYILSSDITLSSIVFSVVAVYVYVFIAILATYWKINRLNFIEALKERIT